MPINCDSILKQVYDIIKKDIIEQKLKQGELIPTKQIAEEHKISVTPVRIALQGLTDYGLVVKKERVGYYVKKFTRKEILDILKARLVFELYGIQEHFDKLNIAKFKKIYDRINSKEMTKDEYRKLDVALHVLFVEATKNDFLLHLYKQMQDLFQLFMFIDRDTSNNENLTNNCEHNDILKAILAGDRLAAGKALIAHFDEVYETVVTLTNAR